MFDIAQWLAAIGLPQYASLFDEHDIDLEVLPDLDHDTLREMGVSSTGHRLKILKAATQAATEVASTPPVASGGERRPLTVMFCDMVGSTNLSVRLDPEDLSDLNAYYRDTCTAVIEQYGGYVSRYYGDGLLVFFGYPNASEHDPEDAARAGLAIIEKLAQYKNRFDIKLQVRIGIANGDVVVGELIGKGESMERSVVGDTPNLAARLQTHAEPDTVVVSNRVRRLIGEMLEYSDLGKVEFKGFDKPVQTWQVLGNQSVTSRFAATRSGRKMAPLAGRNNELAHLIEQWSEAENKRGTVTIVSAEAGMGKSRLMEAVLEHIADKPHTIVRYNCMPSGTNSALRPLIDQLTRAAGITGNDDGTSALDKLDALLSKHLETTDIALVAEMLSLPAGERYPTPDITPQVRKEQTLEAVLKYLVSLTQQTPLIIFFEDLHWIDPSTLEFLTLLPARLTGHSIMLVGSARPEFVSPWPTDQRTATNLSAISLNRLDEDASIELLTAASNGKLATEVMAEIIAKADGIPLYLEELALAALEQSTDTVTDSNTDTKAALETKRNTVSAIPDTLQAALVGRLDRLGSAKALTQVCAVIGRHFTIGLVAQVTSIACDVLREEFARLTRADLIFPLSGDAGAVILPGASYSFKHALVQETAYTTLLRGRRRELHKKIADVLCTDSAIVQTQPERIAQHLTAANALVESIEYWRNAGLIAMGKFSNAEAISHFENALAAVAAIDDPQRRCGEELALTVLGTVPKMLTQGWAAPDVKSGYERARELCDMVGNAAPAELFSTRSGLGSYYIVTGNWAEANRIVSQNLELAQSYGLAEMLTEANVEMSVVKTYSNTALSSLAYMETAINSFDPADTPKHLLQYGRHPLVVAYTTRAVANWTLGKTNKAFQDSRSALAIVEQTPHPFSKAWALSGLALLNTLSGNLAENRVVIDEWHDYTQQQQFPYWFAQALIFGGWLNLLEDKPADAALADIDQGLQIWRASGTRMLTPLMNTPRAMALLKLERYDDAQQSISDQFAYIEQSGENWWAPEIQRLSGLVIEGRHGTGNEQALEAAMKAHAMAMDSGALALALRAANDACRHNLVNGKPELVAPLLTELVERMAPHGDATTDILLAREHLARAEPIQGT